MSDTEQRTIAVIDFVHETEISNYSRAASILGL